jgi:hypothetical protein
MNSGAEANQLRLAVWRPAAMALHSGFRSQMLSPAIWLPGQPDESGRPARALSSPFGDRIPRLHGKNPEEVARPLLASSDPYVFGAALDRNLSHEREVPTELKEMPTGLKSSRGSFDLNDFI